MARFGPFALLLAPFVPGLRTLVPLLFGALGFPLLPYLLLSALGSLLWTQGLVLFAYFLGQFAYFLGQRLPAWLLWLGLFLLALLPLLARKRKLQG